MYNEFIKLVNKELGSRYPVNDINPLYYINLSNCWVVAYLLFIFGKNKGRDCKIYSGPYHVWLVDDGKVYDGFNPNGSEKPTLPDDFKKIVLESYCEDDWLTLEELNDDFYYGGEYVNFRESSYFGNGKELLPVIDKIIKDNNLNYFST